jgi:hypothetical protein
VQRGLTARDPMPGAGFVPVTSGLANSFGGQKTGNTGEHERRDGKFHNELKHHGSLVFSLLLVTASSAEYVLACALPRASQLSAGSSPAWTWSVRSRPGLPTASGSRLSYLTNAIFLTSEASPADILTK